MNQWGKVETRSARVWVLLFVVIAMLSPLGTLAAQEKLEVMFGAWGKVDNRPEARGCRLYADRADGDYFVLSKGYVVTGGSCTCILEGERPSGNCFDVNLFCRCDDGFTVRRRDQRLCPTGTRSRLEVTEAGETISYERCKTRR